MGAGFGYFSASVGGARFGGLGAVGRGSCSSAPIVVKLRVGPVGAICGLGGFGGLGGFDGCGLGLVAVGRGGCPLACALVPSGSCFARMLLGAVWRVVWWQCPAG